MEVMKKCFKCGVKKELRMFYKHLQMADGHLNKCKSCCKQDVSNNYRKNIQHYEAYEKQRAKEPTRKANALIYQQRRREKYRGKDRARQKIARAVQAGQIKRQPCEVCNEPLVEAHHTDYRKPADVKWLCREHHLKQHGKNKY